MNKFKKVLLTAVAATALSNVQAFDFGADRSIPAGVAALGALCIAGGIVQSNNARKAARRRATRAAVGTATPWTSLQTDTSAGSTLKTIGGILLGGSVGFAVWNEAGHKPYLAANEQALTEKKVEAGAKMPKAQALQVVKDLKELEIAGFNAEAVQAIEALADNADFEVTAEFAAGLHQVALLQAEYSRLDQEAKAAAKALEDSFAVKADAKSEVKEAAEQAKAALKAYNEFKKAEAPKALAADAKEQEKEAHQAKVTAYNNQKKAALDGLAKFAKTQELVEKKEAADAARDAASKRADLIAKATVFHAGDWLDTLLAAHPETLNASLVKDLQAAAKQAAQDAKAAAAAQQDNNNEQPAV